MISQFTLYGDTRKGRRPSFVAAAAPDQAAGLIDVFTAELRRFGRHGSHRIVRGNDGCRADQRRPSDPDAGGLNGKGSWELILAWSRLNGKGAVSKACPA